MQDFQSPAATLPDGLNRGEMPPNSGKEKTVPAPRNAGPARLWASYAEVNHIISTEAKQPFPKWLPSPKSSGRRPRRTPSGGPVQDFQSPAATPPDGLNRGDMPPNSGKEKTVPAPRNAGPARLWASYAEVNHITSTEAKQPFPKWLPSPKSSGRRPRRTPSGGPAATPPDGLNRGDMPPNSGKEKTVPAPRNAGPARLWAS